MSYLNLSSFLLTLFFITFTFSSSSSYLVSATCNKNDRNTLLKLKHSLRNPPSLSNWVPTTDCCTWINIQCYNDRVAELFLSHLKSPSIFPFQLIINNLPSLNKIYIGESPNLKVTITPSITRLTNLTSLQIRSTRLSGSVPSFLCSLHKLDTLVLSDNHLTGPIPDCLGNRRRKLNILDLSRNQISGHIPPSLGRMARQAHALYLQNNQLIGQIPPALGKVDFTEIDLSNNRLTGDATFLFDRFKLGIILLNLSRNELDFDMSNVSFPLNLLRLDLSHNKLRGGIPPHISKQKLPFISFDVRDNSLCGPIPKVDAFRVIPAYYFMHNKCLCGGPLPACSHHR